MLSIQDFDKINAVLPINVPETQKMLDPVWKSPQKYMRKHYARGATLLRAEYPLLVREGITRARARSFITPLGAKALPG